MIRMPTGCDRAVEMLHTEGVSMVGRSARSLHFE